MMEALIPHLVALKIFAVIGSIVGYFVLGWWLTESTNNKYGYDIWNWVTILSLLYMAVVWIAFIIGSEKATELQLLVTQVSSAVAFVILWLYSGSKTSLSRGFCVTVYQTSVCALVIAVVMLIFIGLGSKDER